MGYNIISGGAGSGSGATPYPRGLHTTSGDTIDHWRPDDMSVAVGPASVINAYGTSIDDGGFWDFGHPSNIYAVVLTGRNGNNDMEWWYVNNASDDNNFQPSELADWGYTFACCFRIMGSSDGGVANRTIAQHCSSTGNTNEFLIGTGAGENLYVGSDTTGGWQADGLGSALVPTINTWHHLVYSCDAGGTSGAVWLDGVKQTYTRTNVPAANGASTRLRMGNTYWAPGTTAIFNPIVESAACSDARAAALFAAIDIR